MTDGARPVLDQTTLERLSGLAAASGDTRLLARLTDLFTQDTESRLATMRATADRGDDERLRAIAHTVRGAAATVGASEVVELCNELEYPPEDTSTRASAAVLDELHAAFERAREALQHFVADVERNLTTG